MIWTSMMSNSVVRQQKLRRMTSRAGLDIHSPVTAHCCCCCCCCCAVVTSSAPPTQTETAQDRVLHPGTCRAPERGG